MTADLPESAWRTSSYSGDQANCVEVGHGDQYVGIRDSKAQADGTVLLNRAAFTALLRSLG